MRCATVLPFRLLAVTLVLSVALPAWACRIILPPPPPVPPPRPQPVLQEMQVRSHRATLEVNEFTAKVTVQATFYNPNSRRIEGTYVFPIAREAAVSSFAMTVNGKTLEAELLPADKARQIYEGIVRRMRDPALLEYLDDGLLQARVFPIEPNSEVKIELSYEQKVSRDGDLCRVKYPFLSAKPGGDGRIANATVDVKLKTRSPLRTLYTPGFESSTEKSGTTGRATWEGTNVLPDKDFEVVFAVGKDPVGVNFLGYKKGDDGYFLMFVSPNSELQAEEIAAKEISFVLDTSGSMNGTNMEQAKEALRFCVNSLGKKDYFNIVAFATDVLPLAQAPLPATKENRDKALAFIDELRARGGTAIDDALAFSLKTPLVKGTVPLTVFLTDGRPTIGEVDIAAILGHLKKAETSRRIFTFGVGNDVNVQLLDGIANDTRGYTTYVRPGEDLELSISGFYDKVSSPVMTDLQLDTKDVKVTELMPKELPDLFKGGQLVLSGRYQGKGKEKLVVSGEVGGRREKFVVQADLDGDPRNAFVPRLWAIRRVGYLQEQIKQHGANNELIDEIKRLGREYGILTPYTSYLVVEEGLAVSERQAARRDLQAVQDRYQADMEAASGPAAVDAAESISRMKSGAAAPKPSAPLLSVAPESPARLDDRKLSELVVQAGDKTFYRRSTDGFYYDSLIPAGSAPKIDEEVKAWSDAYFKLLAKYPALRTYVQAGTRLVVKIDGKIIRITE